MLSLRQASRMRKVKRPIPASIHFEGGLDQVTPPLSLPSGFVRSSQNYECDVNGGYARVIGYERYSGQPSPSSKTYSIINITLTGAIAVNNTVTGATSGATALVLAVATGYIVVTKIAVSTFQSAEVLNVGGNPQATTTSLASQNGASTLLLNAQYKALAADAYRADISAPTGSGTSLGGKRFNGVTYTFRNNAGGTAANLWKSTASGWSQITLYNEISFTAGGVTAPAEGTTLTQGGVTSTIKRVVLTSGTWAGGTAAGRLIITNPAGGNFAGGAATVGAINLTLSAIQTAIVIQPDGQYEITKANFGGSINTIRLYGVDGVNRGFELADDIYVPISTGMAVDTPTHVCAHKNHLFFSFVGSVQFSGPGTPYVWSVILGAGELAMGDVVNGMQTQPGSETVGAMAVFTHRLTSILYGTGAADFQLIGYRAELGAYPYTIQDVGYSMFLDDLGVTALKTVQAFGNFAHDALTARVYPYVNTKRTKASASVVVRDKSQYRLFFSDGTALYVTFDGKKIVGSMPIVFPDSVEWADETAESDGTESIFFGSTNGMVYQMEKGTSFDGKALGHYFNMAWDFLKSPRTLKRFHDCMLEVSGNGFAEFQFSYQLGYASTNVGQPLTQSEDVNFAQAKWNEVKWNEFVWNGQTLAPSVMDMGGEAENVSLSVKGSSTYDESIRFSGAVLHYTVRRELR